jgi:integrase
MITLYNGCTATEPKVWPKNWKTKTASLKKEWYFWYRFYDPTVTGPNGKIKPKLILCHGVHKYKILEQRQEAMEILLRRELIKLQERGYNPITDSYMINHQEEVEGDILPETPFISALKAAASKLDVVHRTRRGILSVINGVEKAALQLRLLSTPICKITRKNIKQILERCEVSSKQWSNTRYNQYRAYLMMLYTELVEQEAVSGNPIRDISKRSVVQKIRPVPSDPDRIRIKKHLTLVHPQFYSFVQLFFHSGVRITELLSLKPSQIDLKRQIYRCIIKKGKKHREVERTIKSIAVPLWEEFLDGCPHDHYIFGAYFKPALKPMYPEVPSRYWKKYVKKGLGIEADFYSLKHLNTSEVVDMLDEQAAATLNGHTSTAMVVNIYDVKQKQRQHDRLKKITNKFA